MEHEEMLSASGTAAQKFFEKIYTETLRPHFGDKEREFVRNLLLRAQEARIYHPPTEAK